MTHHISAKTLVSRYKASKMETPKALGAIDFPGFLDKIKKLTDAERKAREDYRESTNEVLREISEFGKQFRTLPKEFSDVWKMVHGAGQSHREDPRLTSLLFQLNEARLHHESIARQLYGAL